MLLTSRGHNAALSLPVLLLGLATILGVLAVGSLLKGPAWGVVVPCGLFSSFAFWAAFDELALIRMDGATLRVWGPFRRGELRASGAAFGVRLRPSSRASRYVIFATDGQASIDLAELGTLRGARAGIERLSRALYGGHLHIPNARAAQEVETVEREWQASAGEAQQQIDEYYRSPAWRRAKLIVIGVVLAYSIGMILYGYFTGQL
jgi:hypothetical protein